MRGSALAPRRCGTSVDAEADHQFRPVIAHIAIVPIATSCANRFATAVATVAGSPSSAPATAWAKFSTPSTLTSSGAGGSQNPSVIGGRWLLRTRGC